MRRTRLWPHGGARRELLAYTCGIAVDGRAYRWGENKLGQLGDGTTKGHDQPKPVVEPL